MFSRSFKISQAFAEVTNAMKNSKAKGWNKWKYQQMSILLQEVNSESGNQDYKDFNSIVMLDFQSFKWNCKALGLHFTQTVHDSNYRMKPLLKQYTLGLKWYSWSVFLVVFKKMGMIV